MKVRFSSKYNAIFNVTVSRGTISHELPIINQDAKDLKRQLNNIDSSKIHKDSLKSMRKLVHSHY